MKNRCGKTGLVVLVAMSALRAGIAVAENDGNSLLLQCRAAVDVTDMVSAGREPPEDAVLTFNASSCLAYLRGFRDLAAFWDVWLSPFMRSVGRADLADHGAGAPFCIPENANPGQLARVIVKYLEAHPEKLHEADAALTLAALLQSFPCVIENR